MEDLTRTNPTEDGKPQGNASDSDMRFAPGVILAERYRIVGRLGQGGMGDVFRADDLKLGVSVALKFLPEGIAADPERLSRLHHEVRTARTIAHTNICRVYDIVEASGQHFITMEYIDGEDLASLLRRIGRLSGDKTIEMMRQLCMGVAAAHDAGVLHRDLKPANIMIDGRGRVRITDFGLAGMATQFKGLEARAGTPAYMAPEQFEKGEVSVSSDIYALGLVLYEMVTGRRTFAGESLEEYKRLHRLETPTNPSNVTHEIDPAVERVILQCLEKDPELRPKSAIAVAAALPGADPLAAALAAGETPSPELVAAAGSSVGIRPSLALAALVWCLVSMVAFIVVASPFRLYHHAPLQQHAYVLTAKAKEHVAALSTAPTARDQAATFATRMDCIRSLERAYKQAVSKLESSDVAEADREALEQTVAAPWRDLGHPRATSVIFVYRQSPYPLMPFDRYQRVTWNDPPRSVPGMVTVWLDLSGRLIFYHAVPNTHVSAREEPVAWSDLFQAAELDIANFEPTEPTWTPHSYCDERAAWKGTSPDRPDYTLLVEAGLFKGEPIYFEVFEPWQFNAPPPPEATESQQRAAASAAQVQRIAAGIMFFLSLFAAVATVVLAWRNLRLGRGDQRGAMRLAVYLMIIQALLWLLTGQVNIQSIQGVSVANMLSYALLYAMAMWLAYVAIEPFVRRRWPTTLISWTRLLSGRVTDPLVARDVLFGASFGIISAWAFMIPHFEGVAMPVNGETQGQLNNLLGPRFWIGSLLEAQLDPILLSMAFLVFIFVLRAMIQFVLQRVWPQAAGQYERLAVIAFILLLTFMNASQNLDLNDLTESHWLRMIGSVGIYVLWFFALLRFGVLCLIVSNIFLGILLKFPLTTDMSAWYAGSTVFAVGTMTIVLVYAAYKSLAGRPLLKTEFLDQ